MHRAVNRRGWTTIAMILILMIWCGLSGCSSSDPTTPAGNNTTAAFTEPVNGATVSGVVTITGSVANADTVRFYCDGVEIGALAISPFQITWNSGQVADGAHVLTIRAVRGQQVAKTQITVTVNNGGGVVAVSVTPPAASVALNATRQFTADVTGTTNTAVTWTVEEGATRGTISAAGLYTAPAALPNPATATVKATSVADPTKSGTATVTLTSGGSSQTEQDAIMALFNSAYDVGDIGLESVQIGAEAVWAASEFSGGALTVTGTLTQSAPNSDVWSYSATPADKLVVAYSGGPTLEYVFTQFTGYLDGTWEDFVDAHTVNFTVASAGLMDLHIQSDKHYTKGGQAGEKAWDAVWTRSIDGTYVFGGVTYNLDVLHQGQEIDCYVEPPFAHYEYDETYTGTIITATSTITLNQGFWSSYMHNSDQYLHLLSTALTNNSSANYGGTVYTWDDLYVLWHAGSVLSDPGYYSVVIDSHQWGLRGRLLKDGAIYGELQYNGPVVNDSHGPDLYLHLVTGEDVFMHTLIQFP
ncbi:MAG: Ig-like domain-containing protein [bacterium]